MRDRTYFNRINNRGRPRLTYEEYLVSERLKNSSRHTSGLDVIASVISASISSSVFEKFEMSVRSLELYAAFVYHALEMNHNGLPFTRAGV